VVGIRVGLRLVGVRVVGASEQLSSGTSGKMLPRDSSFPSFAFSCIRHCDVFKMHLSVARS